MRTEQTLKSDAKLVYCARMASEYPDHHLYKLGKNQWPWCILLTFENGDGSLYRLRRALNTADLDVAKKRRDAIIKDLLGKYGISDNETILMLELLQFIVTKVISEEGEEE